MKIFVSLYHKWKLKKLWSCKGSKSPGLDEFNFLFIRKCFHFMKEDFFRFFKDFYSYARLSKSITSSFLTLVPKKDISLGLGDYRPICLIGCLFKALSKLLVNRLKRVLSLNLSTCQSAFVSVRQLLDGVLVANEVVDYASKGTYSCLLLKVDFEKAYDKVNWKFLFYMLRRLCFGKVWIKWMETMVCSSGMSVLVNGGPTKEFQVGVLHRETLYLPRLSTLVKKAVCCSEFKPFLVGSNCIVKMF